MSPQLMIVLFGQHPIDAIVAHVEVLAVGAGKADPSAVEVLFLGVSRV
jgi:hypothetical protein